jgi:hypothetical protein
MNAAKPKCVLFIEPFLTSFLATCKIITFFINFLCKILLKYSEYGFNYSL